MQEITGLQCLVSGSTPARSRAVLLHGRGASAEDLYSLGDQLPARMLGIFPQGPLPFPPGQFQMGWAWFDMAPNHMPGLVASAEKLPNLLDELIKGDPARAAATFLGGFSQGGIMTLDVGLRYRPKLAGLVVMSAYLLDEGRAFQGVADGDAPPVCLVHGTQDDVIPMERSRTAKKILEKHGVSVTHAEYDMGHAITADSWIFVNRFLEDLSH
jgi:phospholipase/carboxylesterase